MGNKILIILFLTCSLAYADVDFDSSRLDLYDGRFLKLDASNDPITGDLEISSDLTLSGSTSTLYLEGSIDGDLIPLIDNTYDVGKYNDKEWRDIAVGRTTYVDDVSTDNTFVSTGTSPGASDSLDVNLYSQVANKYIRFNARDADPDLEVVADAGITGDLTISGTATIGGDLTLSGTTAGLYTDYARSASGGDIKLQPNNEGDIIVGGDTDVADDVAGKKLIFRRSAAEGDDSWEFFTDDTREAILQTTTVGTSMYINSSGRMELEVIGNNDLFLTAHPSKTVTLNKYGSTGGVVIGNQFAGSGSNPFLRHRGYITAALTNKYIQYQLSDTTDKYEITREDTNILGMDIQMPLEGDDLELSSDLTVDGTTFVVDSTNNRVGIGTASPTTALEVNGTIGVADDIEHIGDTHTSLQFQSNRMIFNAGGTLALDAFHDLGRTLFNGDQKDYDFIVASDDSANAFMVDAGNSNVGINDTTPDAKLDVEGDAIIGTDLTVNGTLFGGYTGTGKTLRIQGDVIITSDLTLSGTAKGTLVFSDGVWNELPPTPVTAAKLGSTAPTLTTFLGAIEQYAFDASNDYIIGATEVTHGYKEGTDIYAHVHWATNGTEGTDAGVNWQLTYSIANYGWNVFSAADTLSTDDTIPANTGDRAHRFTGLGAISGTDVKIGSYIVWRFERIASGIAAPSADPFGIAVGFHTLFSTVGSRTELTK